MQFAIASGKGGTGKTTLATNLARALAADGVPVAYLDCDVEEPNGHIFLRPKILSRNEVTIPVPEVDFSRCTYCRACAQACRFSAIVAFKTSVLTFPKLCHGCGGCALACPEKAIREVARPIGTIEEGETNGLAFVHGRLDIGEAMSPPLIRAVLDRAPVGHTIVVDAPPGTSCPVIASVKGADAVLLVTEPTPFGLSDLRLAVAMVRALGRPFGVAVNRADVGDREVFGFCEREGIPVLFELGEDRRIAYSYSRGELALQAIPDLAPRFLELAKRLRELAEGGLQEPVGVSSVSARDDDERLPTLPSLKSNHVTLGSGATTSSLRLPGLPSLRSDHVTLGPSRPPRELVVISGKGGTGKTSLVASFFALADGAVVADCDVDAADLYLVLDPHVQARWPFSGGCEAQILADACTACGLCIERCRFNAIRSGPDDDTDGVSVFEVDRISCEGCGVCVDACPEQAVKLIPSTGGEWFLSSTRHGPMLHARLGVAQENSGRLVSLVRREARAVASQENRRLVLVDGPPGIGCPVIASVTGAHLVLLVSEPSLSAIHDLKRVAEVCQHFDVPAAACINKADLNLEVAELLTREAEHMGVSVLGRVRYDPAVTRAQVRRKCVVEDGPGPAARDIRRLWDCVRRALQSGDPREAHEGRETLGSSLSGS